MTTFPHMTASGIKPGVCRRRTVTTFDGRRRLVVSMEAGDLITIREEGRRFAVSESVHAVYSWAVKRWAVEEQRRKQAEKKARRLSV